jgi:ribosomal protein S18 acetylase RimI-like enzyme
MKYTLKRNSINPIEEFSKWEVQELTLKGTELFDSLKFYLSNVMEGILDPDISGKKPDGFLNNLQSGKLGDFSKRYIIAAQDNSKVVGLLIGIPEEKEKLHIYSMGVLTAYRGRGVGSALLARCINDMLKNNIREIILDVHSDNVPAYNLYSKFGFQ